MQFFFNFIIRLKLNCVWYLWKWNEFLSLLLKNNQTPKKNKNTHVKENIFVLSNFCFLIKTTITEISNYIFKQMILAGNIIVIWFAMHALFLPIITWKKSHVSRKFYCFLMFIINIETKFSSKISLLNKYWNL